MTTIILYKYVFEDDSKIITPNPIEGYNYTSTLTRLIADEGFELTDGTSTRPCVDTETPEDWTEVPIPDTHLTEEEFQYIEIAKILTGEED